MELGRIIASPNVRAPTGLFSCGASQRPLDPLTAPRPAVSFGLGQLSLLIALPQAIHSRGRIHDPTPSSRFSFLAIPFVLTLGFPCIRLQAAAQAAPTSCQRKAKRRLERAEYSKWVTVWTKLLNGEPADPSNPQHKDAIDAASKYAAFRLTWEPEERTWENQRGFSRLQQRPRIDPQWQEKTQKTGELFIKGVIAHAADVMKTNKPVKSPQRRLASGSHRRSGAE